MICTFCGLETGMPTAHETQEACIEALRSQVSALRSVLRHTRRADESPQVREKALVHTIGAVSPK